MITFISSKLCNIFWWNMEKYLQHKNHNQRSILYPLEISKYLINIVASTYVTDRSPNANVVKEYNDKCQMILISIHKFEQDQLRWHHFQYHHYDCVLNHQVIQSLHSKSFFLEVLPNSKKNHQRYNNEKCTKAMMIISSEFILSPILRVPTFKKNSSDLAGWWIFWTIFHEDFKNANFINVGHYFLHYSFLPNA